MDRMGDGPTQPVIHTVIIDTMPNNNRLNNGHGLKNVMCKEDLGTRKVAVGLYPRKTTMTEMGPLRFHIRGLLSDTTYHMARCCAEDLNSKDPDLFPDPDIEGMLEFDWDMYVDEKRKELKGDAWVFSDKAMVFCNEEFIGGPGEFLKWAEQEHNYENFRPKPLYETLAEEAYKNHLNSNKHDYVFMDISIDEKPIGKLVFELFTDMVPKTSDNFRMLCTGEKGESPHTEYKLHYKDSLFHRVVPNGWIQGGDIWMKRGDGGESVYGPVFEDENFIVSHNRRGIISMANKGRHTNGSQFFITLQPSTWMDTKYVAFGQIIEGTEVLKAMEAQSTNNERPLKDIKVTYCGTCRYEF